MPDLVGPLQTFGDRSPIVAPRRDRRRIGITHIHWPPVVVLVRQARLLPGEVGHGIARAVVQQALLDQDADD